MRTLIADTRFALRALARRPAFALAVIAILALGIGANTAMFSIVNAVLLRPLSYPQADQLVILFQRPPQDAFPGFMRFAVSPANFYDWKRDARQFERMAIVRPRPFAVTGRGTAEMIEAATVGADFFEILRAQPAMGRVFLPEEDAPGRSRVVILSDGFWRARFGGSADAVGQPLTLDGVDYTVVGVMPAAFSVGAWDLAARDVWVPIALTDAERAVRENHNTLAVARLKPGVDAAQAQAEMNALSTRLEREFPKENAGWGATVVPMQEVMVGDIRTSLVMLLGAVGLVLLIACANVGNLLYVRALARRKEITIRAALGAGRGRVFQQLLVEALVLAAAGGVTGLVLARGILSVAGTVLAPEFLRDAGISIDQTVLLFTGAVSLMTGILAGALPALRAGQTSLTDALNDGGRHDGTLGIRLRRAFVVGEVALSLVLLMGAGVMLRSLAALRSVETGFNTENVLTMRVSLPEARYATAAQTAAFFDTVMERIRTLPGVQAAGTIDSLPTTGGSVQPIVVEGRPERLPNEQPTVQVRRISPGYLRAMNIPVLQGRDLTERDTEVMLVSRGAARLLWGDEDPLGGRTSLPLVSRSVFNDVIGVVGDIKDELDEAAEPSVYVYSRTDSVARRALAIRTSVPPLSVAQSAAGVVRALDTDQPVEDIRTMDTIVEEALTAPRFSATLLGLFAAVALILASIGIYSLLAYIVRGRSREIGIRSALGAQTTDVLTLVVLEGMMPALIGIGVGILASLAAARMLDTLVFDVSASDPLTLAAVAATLTIVALLASVVPAYRAARLDPATVLRLN